MRFCACEKFAIRFSNREFSPSFKSQIYLARITGLIITSVLSRMWPTINLQFEMKAFVAISPFRVKLQSFRRLELSHFDCSSSFRI